jgi:hypothetical protein
MAEMGLFGRHDTHLHQLEALLQSGGVDGIDGHALG